MCGQPFGLADMALDIRQNPGDPVSRRGIVGRQGFRRQMAGRNQQNTGRPLQKQFMAESAFLFLFLPYQVIEGADFPGVP